LILSRNKTLILIEIKSTDRIETREVEKLVPFMKETKANTFYLSQDPHIEKIKGVMCMPWQKGIKKIFGL